MVNATIPHPSKIGTVVFEFTCPKCRKTRRAHIRNADVGSKEMDLIICRCGHQITIHALKYLFRDTEFVEELLQYFVQ